MHVLLIEGDQAKVDQLSRFCRNVEIEFEVVHPKNLEPKSAALTGWDVIVLDFDSRFVPIFQIIATLREESKGLTMILTHSAMTGTEHAVEIQALRAGSDTHLTWPVSEELFIAKLEVLKWRRDILTLGRQDIYAKLIFNEIELDTSSWECHVHSEKVFLTVTEFKFLEAMIKEPGILFSRDRLMDVAYGPNITVDDRTIDSHIKRLRKKLTSAGANNYIETRYGVGYSLQNNPHQYGEA